MTSGQEVIRSNDLHLQRFHWRRGEKRGGRSELVLGLVEIRGELTVYLNRHFLDNDRHHLGALCPTLELRAEKVARNCAYEQLVDDGLDALIGRRMAQGGDLYVVMPPRHFGSRSS